MDKKIISFLVGIVCVVIGIFILVSYFKAQRLQISETTATIIRIDIEVETDSDGYDTRYYYPVIEYTVAGKKYEKRLPDSGTTDSTEYQKGQTVEIKYNPDNPNEISKKDGKGGLIGGIFFILFGIISTIATFNGKQ